MSSLEILERLVGFPTVSRTPNIELIDFVRDRLETAGIECQVISSEDGRNANLYARTGPENRPGIMLSGHTDVVPVEGQSWDRDPFVLSESDGRLYGRGTADMKGFVACALSAMLSAATRPLSIPLQLALSYDEEIGCVGVHRLLDVLEDSPFPPAMCIVGEPTGLVVATGHKGKTALRATCTGREVHSALAPSGLNAIHLAADFVNVLRAHQRRLETSGHQDTDYDVPYSTLHAGLISGGVVLNIVPKTCTVDFEIRNLAVDSAADILEAMQADVRKIVDIARQHCPEAAIDIDIVNSYPGLDTSPDDEVVSFVKSLTGGNATLKVAFGTEGGLFNERIGVATVVCGPGSMDQGHKPDEFITREQLERCDAMLSALVERLST